MADKTTQVMQARVLVARRYVQHGFLDAAMRLFIQDPAPFAPKDWTDLAEKMIERDRIADAVEVCEIGGVPLPRERLLKLGDHYLDRRDTDRAIHFYEIGTADRERWSRVVDVLTTMPAQELRAIELAGRYLVSDAPAVPDVAQRDHRPGVVSAACHDVAAQAIAPIVLRKGATAQLNGSAPIAAKAVNGGQRTAKPAPR